MLIVAWRWGRKMNSSKAPGHYLCLQVKVRWFVHVLVSEASSSSQLVKSLWSHRIIGAGYGALQLQRWSRSCPCLLFFPHWQLDTALSHPGAAAKCPAGSSSWWNYGREPQASGYPPSATLNVTDELMGKTLRLPWYQSTSGLQRTPLKISENLIAFCHWIDKCWASRMSSLAQLSWHSCSNTSSTKPSLLTSMWFCFTFPFLL